ncbi:Glycosyltransferase involved in cell wall bisynthesis [Chryseolinea serpens]|uniref:Glycosyltransferase involved in cell wall bisynthesis n=1 Tax=Chryseolinea serpens TaxID=947013 RepID=A0A1M5NCU1_9BACT|nr:Glycosyltransferase involved in cell wall bisynthesis [Chryseolinea serpens]
MLRRKIVYIVSDVEKSLAFEWMAAHFNSRAELFFLLIGKRQTALISFLEQTGVRYQVVADEDGASFFRKWLAVLSLLRRERPHVVHAHLWRAQLMGMTAAWLLRVPKRIFTRHHAALHHEVYPTGLKWDKLCNRLATGIVAISQNVQNILTQWEGAAPAKIHLIHHGFDLAYFAQPDPQAVASLRQRHGVPPRRPVIGVIARYLELKGIPYVVEAFKTIRKEFPEAFLILANAHGVYAPVIKKSLADVPAEAYKEVIFENDLASLYAVMDIFVHVPTGPHVEAFGQTYVEALAAGVPAVFTLSGVAPEFIVDRKNACVVAFRNAGDIASAISNIWQNDALRENLVTEGKRSVQPFSLENMLHKLETLYA